jgi:hypothetical protein
VIQDPPVQTSYNALTTQLALMQGIEIGSKEWTDGGLWAFSGQTGGHPAYGWRRTEEMTGARCRAVIANYAARPCYYDPTQHPERESGYGIAGRPKDWTQADDGNDPMDMPNGERAYMTESGIVKVSGPDVQHFWIDPLLDIIDRAPASIHVATPWGRFGATQVAKSLATMLMDALTGQVRHHGKFWGGGRTFARVVDSFVQAHKRGCVRPENAAVFIHWVREYGLPALETPPGVSNAKGAGVFNLYQGLSWVMPACYDAEALFAGLDGEEASALAARFGAAKERLVQWALDIDAIKGGKGAWSHADITPEIAQGIDGKPLSTLLGSLEPEEVHGPEWYGDWAVRAADICRKVQPGQQAEDYFQRVFDGAKNSKSGGPWLVDADRNWLPL